MTRPCAWIPAMLFSLAISIKAASAAIMPGGMAASGFAAPGSASTLEISQRIERDPGAEPYFWATQFWVNTTTDHGGYFGMQTNGSDGTRPVGKLFIFSIWNATAAEPGPGAIALPFGGEGVGYSLRLPHAWIEGADYRFRLTREEGLWWRLRISGPGLDANVGRIRVTAEAALRNSVLNFTEYYVERASCEAVPAARARFSGFTYGGAAGAPNYVNTYGNCARIAGAVVDGNSTVHTIANGAIALPASLSGSWYEPASSGQGLSVEVIDADRFLVFFYGFDSAGAPLWLYGEFRQSTPGFAFGRALTANMISTTGTRWSPFVPGDVRRTPWGTATFTFDSCLRARLVLDGSTGTKTLNLEKLVTPRGLSCQ